MTRHEALQVKAGWRRAAFSPDQVQALAALDQMTDYYGSESAMPPDVRAVHDQLAAKLRQPKET